MYVRRIGEQLTTFGVSGKLWRDALVMYDRQSGSLWSQVSGIAIMGDRVGQSLEAFPALHMTWKEWESLHPETLVLDKGGDGHRSPYSRYFDDKRRLGIFGRTNVDNRLDGKDIVQGARVDDIPIVFPFKDLRERPLINYKVGDNPILIVFSRAGKSAAVFSRRLGDRTLSFRNLKREDGLLSMQDIETNTVWSALEGEALSGPLEGSRLTFVPSTSVFWFGWRGFFPNTLIYDPNAAE